ncbi:MAG: nickel pincer cofactor biosynthesis protein LarC [Thermodesulfobacteriota bacterium]|nr:nickel pincer cofactor biosynthesis protein LarC [Thermodesulfobacteriota bacterium]
MLAYFDCFSGISGDMTLGSLIDLGVPVEWLQERLREIPLTDFDIAVEPILRNGLRAQNVYVNVKDDGTSRNYDHIKSLIKSSPLSAGVKNNSLEIFKKIASAEAKIHGCLIQKVHFHEVGGVDAIVDIVGTALCLEYLGIKKVIASKIPLGRGFVSCSHGTLPLPAPATIEILKDVPVYGTEIDHELVTPTGAAIIASLADSFEAMPQMTVEKIGYGAGKNDLGSRPNLLRVIVGTASAGWMENHAKCQKDRIVVVETCIDDMNPEIFGFLMDRLLADGVLDVLWIPVFMKKNRPGTMIQVLCRDETKDRVIHRILSETTSLGIRYYDVQRRFLQRQRIKIKTKYGRQYVKQVKDLDGSVRIVPEYEVCKKIASEKNIPIRKVYETIAGNTEGIKAEEVRKRQQKDKH